MSKFKQSVFRKLLVITNCFVILIYLLVCLVPYINTKEYWVIALPGLAFPIIFFALFCLILLWAILKSGWAWVSLIALLLGFQQIIAVFSFHLPGQFSPRKPTNSIRVLQWNVSSWDEDNKKRKEKKGEHSFRPLMMNLLEKQDADVMCFEEFFESADTDYFKSNISAITKMGFLYHYFVPSENYKNDYESGIAIFSKYPMIDSAKFGFNPEKSDEHLLYTDIKVNDKIFRIFATHLQSVHFESSEYQSLSRLKRATDPGFHESRTIVSKLKRGYIARYNQAELVEQKIAESPYPAFICGDFNDVPNSSTYFKAKGKLQDTFLKKGYWIGRTFRFISPTLRIDYILADKRFKVNQFQTIHVPYSDHYPVETDLQY
ncbi:MAG: endonuclease/exonuclease/phosphatase family protein [Bacteroidota bacterium]|nr:endonuclease/exonuclease/phosphatase family protein [Bacteroidota bacterium]